ncbi:MAG: HD domain-containing protein [Chloroflexota bacterium]
MNFAETSPKDFPIHLIGSEVSLLLNKVSNILAEQGVQSYIVGGIVRDVLLGRDTADIDIAVASDALEVAPRVAEALGGKYVLLDKENGVGRVVLLSEGAPSAKGQWELDFSTFSGSIEQDLARRDFTINAMAVDLGHVAEGFSVAQLIDPFGGWDDLHQGVIRAVAETVFESDTARLLRAVRLAAELGFSIDRETEALIKHYSYLVTSIAGERVREELLRLMAIPGAGFLFYLDELGLLTAVFPELATAKGVEQPKEHFWNVFEHSLNTVTAVDFLLRRGTCDYAGEEVLSSVPWSPALVQHFDQEVSSGSTRRLLLKLAAFLHDVAKPQTKAIDNDGRIRFLGHATEGATIAVNIMEILRFSAREIKLVETIIRHHLRPGQMSQGGLPTQRAIYRYFRDTGEAGIDTLFLNLADHLATRGPRLDLPRWLEHVHVVEYVLSQRFEQENIARPPKLVDGHDIISIFGINPGPEVGEILEAVHEAQAIGEVITREQALAYIRDLLTKTE